MTTVVLLAGASGVGKTQVGHRLARRLGAALVEVDDLVVAVQAITTAGTHPVLHQWSVLRDADMTVDEVVAAQVRLAEALQPAVDAVVAEHVAERTPVVLEGDYLLPGASRPGVRTVVLHEDDRDQLVANYAAREPHVPSQQHRADCSLAYGRWLARRAEAVAVPVVPARPWPSVLERVWAAVAGPTDSLNT
jgi:2-phosphoglycerate kinase